MSVSLKRPQSEDRLSGGVTVAPKHLILVLLIAGACLLTVAALTRPLLAVAMVYALVFWLVATKRPEIALLLIFATAPLQNDLSGGAAAKFSLAEINLYLVIPLLALAVVVQKRLLTLGPLLVPLAVYFAVSVLSSLYHWRGMTTALSLIQMIQYLVLVVFVFANATSRPKDMILVMNGLLCVCVVLAVVGTIVGISSGSSYFLGLHKNGAGASLACGLVIAGERWLAQDGGKRKGVLLTVMAVIATGLVFTLSRGAWMTAAIGLIYAATVRGQLPRLGRAALALTPLIAACWFLLPSASREYAMGFDSKRQNIADRYESIDFARDQFLASPYLGSGVGLRKEYDATNFFWLTLAETGVFGIGALVFLHIGIFRMLHQTQRWVGLTDPRFSVLAVSGGLVLGKLFHGMVDHYWSRGDIMITWASVGMALGVYLSARREQQIRQLAAQRDRDTAWIQASLSAFPGEMKKEVE